MILNELSNQVKKIRSFQTKTMRHAKKRNIIIGVGIGSAVGVAAGILLAPKSGREIRQGISDRTRKTMKNLKENVAATKTRMFDAALKKDSHLHEAGQKGSGAEKESAKKSGDDKKQEASK
jgi:gas vesicle protein